jgi:hypothetical protein
MSQKMQPENAQGGYQPGRPFSFTFPNRSQPILVQVLSMIYVLLTSSSKEAMATRPQAVTHQAEIDRLNLAARGSRYFAIVSTIAYALVLGLVLYCFVMIQKIGLPVELGMDPCPLSPKTFTNSIQEDVIVPDKFTAAVTATPLVLIARQASGFYFSNTSAITLASATSGAIGTGGISVMTTSNGTLATEGTNNISTIP